MGNEASQGVQLGKPIENDIKVTWSRVDCEPSFPPRDCHAACSVDGRMFVFGGVMITGDDDCAESNDLLMLEIGTGKWTKVDGSGKVPPPRSAATFDLVGDKLYLFGGLSQYSGWFQDIYSFDTENASWNKVESSGTPPSPRDKLASAVIGKKIYYFGGFGPKQGEWVTDDDDASQDEELEEVKEQQEAAQFGWFNDLHIFDTETNSWSQPLQMNLGVPTARAALGMCAIDDKLVVFGGRDTEGRTNDLHIFDTVSKKWEADLKYKGRIPACRSFHTATAIGKRVVILGGRSSENHHFQDFHIFDTETKEWLQPEVRGSLPSARGCHSAVVSSEHLVLFGGSSSFDTETMQCEEHFGDVYAIRTEEITRGQALPLGVDERGEVASGCKPSSSTPEASGSIHTNGNGHGDS
ncbi:uncharacterized protein LOC135483936 [Lineus longissimus]|uniref:uncharacterized protein LOC135483936 n=1 Tax=Lineus longissimus TaxID=88925 RepID=UPI002B4FA4B6